jgi:hypothetical protein
VKRKGAQWHTIATYVVTLEATRTGMVTGVCAPVPPLRKIALTRLMIRTRVKRQKNNGKG